MNPPSERPKLYCYVDETGQDTVGELFIVSVVVTDSSRDGLVAILEDIEATSGKGRVKWMKVRGRQRVDYIGAVLSNPAFKGKLYFASYKGSKSYMALTVLSTAKAILKAEPLRHPVVVYVDGLPKARLRWFGVELRHLSVRTSKIVGVRREEADALIRLADACCGFVRAALSGEQPEMAVLFSRAQASGHLIEV